jgi:hypothetical protein
MVQDDIPKEIREFIARFLRSVGHLELFLFLFDGREKEWSVADLVREMRTNSSLVEQQVKDLNGPIKSYGADVPRFRFDIGDESLLETARKISELYRSRRHAMISEIYTQPTATIQSFADAFKFKKD